MDFTDPLQVALQIIIIGTYIFRLTIIDYLPISLELQNFFKNVSVDMKFKIEKWWKTILFPILVIIIAYLGWIIFHLVRFSQLPIYTITDTLAIYVIGAGILAPFSEEIIQCFFLSAGFLIIVHIFKDKWAVYLLNFASFNANFYNTCRSS